MDPRIKFRHLVAFSAIARARSLKTAAEQLNLTQPAISKTLKELETTIGVILMERSRAGVRLTVEGEIFLQFAEQSATALRQGLRSVLGQGGSGGKVRIGVLPSVATYLVPKAVLSFVAEHPEILIEVHEGPHADLTGRLRSGALDLVAGRLGRPDAMHGISFQQLYSEDVVVVTRPDGPAAGVQRFEDLDPFRIMYPPQDSAIRPLVARLLIAKGVPLYPNRIESASPGFGRAVVMADPMCVWFISRGVVAQDLELGHLVELRIDTDPTRGAVGIMTRTEEVPTVAARQFIRSLTTIGQSKNGVH